MASYSQKKQYVALCLGDDEITRRIGELSGYGERAELVTWRGDGMTPAQAILFAQFAESLNDSYNGSLTVSGGTIYRAKSMAELRETVITNELSRREYTEHDMPEDLDDMDAAVQEYLMAQAERQLAPAGIDVS